MLTCLRISLDAMPWRRENRARCKRPADIEVIRVRNRGHMHRLVLVLAHLYLTVGRQARWCRRHGHRRPINGDMTVAGDTDHGSQRRSYRRSAGGSDGSGNEFVVGWRSFEGEPSMGWHARQLALPPKRSGRPRVSRRRPGVGLRWPPAQPIGPLIQHAPRGIIASGGGADGCDDD